jgi:hypothetical protein
MLCVFVDFIRQKCRRLFGETCIALGSFGILTKRVGLAVNFLSCPFIQLKRRDEMQEASRQRLILMLGNTKRNFLVTCNKYFASEGALYRQSEESIPLPATHQPSRSLLVCGNDLLHLLVTAHIDATSVMNMLWPDLQHSLHLTIHSHTTGIFENQSHWLFRSCQQKLPEQKTQELKLLTEHSYSILNLPFGLFLSAGYANMPP